MVPPTICEQKTVRIPTFATILHAARTTILKTLAIVIMPSSHEANLLFTSNLWTCRTDNVTNSPVALTVEQAI